MQPAVPEDSSQPIAAPCPDTASKGRYAPQAQSLGYTPQPMSAILIHAIAAALYGGLAALIWQTYWRGKGPSERLILTTRGLLLVALALHAITLHRDLFASAGLHMGFAQALSVTLWLAVAIYWVQSFFVPLDAMQAFILPLAAVAVFLPAVFRGFVAGEESANLGYRLHLVCAMAAYSLFTIAALHGIFMSMIEKRLHRTSLRGVLAQVPPLLTMERVLFRIIGAGFILLTLVLITGIFFSEEVFGRALRLDHKTVFGVLSWFIFAGLIFGRWRYGWRGRTALRWILAGFLSLLLAYVGSRFVLEVVLGRTHV
jgi:ABC-type uncharacterized transport system permease subunit